MGLREKAKKDKRNRIREAARYVFERKGFEAATTREIAQRAEVAVGTLFVYAPAKRDLLLMVYNDDLETLSAEVNPDAPIIEQLTALFRPRFEFWGRNPELSRYVVREVFEPIHEDEEKEAETLRFRRRRTTVMGDVADIVKRSQAAGEIDANVDPMLVSELIHGIFLNENRQWLESSKPDVDEGVSHMRTILTLALRGSMTAR